MSDREKGMQMRQHNQSNCWIVVYWFLNHYVIPCGVSALPLMLITNNCLNNLGNAVLPIHSSFG